MEKEEITESLRNSPELQETQDSSDKRLHDLGYKSEFRRDMSLFGVLGMSFCAIGILTGMSSAFQTGLFSGGPLGLFWGWNNSATFVFTDLENFTGWESKGFVVLLGFLQAVYTLEGCETAAQVAEEAKRAELLAPAAVVGSIAGSWLIGLAYMLALLFSVQSIPRVQSTAFALPITQLYFDAVGRPFTLMCLVVVGLAQFMAAVTAFTASSRLFYALARDDALPLKRQFMALNRFQAPYWGVWTSVLIGCIISCAYIGSAVAFDAILSSAAIAVMLSYLQPILIRVFWPDSIPAHERGPFHLGRWSWPINVASFMFTAFICVLFILPTARPVNSLNMNYSIVAIGAVIVIVISCWVIWGRHHFRGTVKTIADINSIAQDPEKSQ
ncbi:hypothetical protein CERSUDRAFT_95005 [Gelatoporia subvermispora B]|uniref:Amino acid permease/ SLC12A domain-containing protein n=1 Tax=Ceriporiopsis subvermispora (strain B) TaxID=914234 RepID=M2RE50_CERS8|nr:hypothetical protein CERSUDRAFT_95005 [Gelatoporia subvermispora B]